MHKLLARQLKKVLGTDRLDLLSPEIQVLISRIQEAYEQADVDRSLLERSLELISREMQERYSQLLKEIEQRKQAEETLLKRNADLLKANSLMLGREERILQLKEEVNSLLANLSQQSRYSSAGGLPKA